MVDGKNINLGQNFEQALDQMREVGDRSRFEKQSQEIIDIYKAQAIKNFLTIGGLLRSSEDLNYIKENLPKLEEATQELTGYTYDHLLKCYYPRELPFFDSSKEYKMTGEKGQSVEINDFDVDKNGLVYTVSSMGLAVSGRDKKAPNGYNTLGPHLSQGQRADAKQVLVIGENTLVTVSNLTLNIWNVGGGRQDHYEVKVCKEGEGEIIQDVAVYPDGTLGVLASQYFYQFSPVDSYQAAKLKRRICHVGDVKSLQLSTDPTIFYTDGADVYRGNLNEEITLFERNEELQDFQITSSGQYVKSINAANRGGNRQRLYIQENISEIGSVLPTYLFADELSKKRFIDVITPTFMAIADGDYVKTFRKTAEKWERAQKIETKMIGTIRKVKACENGNIYAMGSQWIGVLTPTK